MAEPDATPQKSGAGCIAGPKKRPHPPTCIGEEWGTKLLGLRLPYFGISALNRFPLKSYSGLD